MKKAMSSLMIVMLLFALSIPTFAEAMDKETVDSVLQDIQKDQNVQDIRQIDLDKVTPELLEQLGDAVMGKLIGDNERHEWMDKMIGGEGSESLKNFHRDLGYRYLKGEPLTIQSMMMGSQWNGKETGFDRSGGTGMMNNLGFGRGYGMMNAPWYGVGGMIMGLLILVLIGGAIFLATRQSGSHIPAVNVHTANEILRQRYANGEITHEEFEAMKKNLEK